MSLCCDWQLARASAEIDAHEWRIEMSVNRRLILAGGAASVLAPTIGRAQDKDVKVRC